jgi:hypothetical protein
MPVFTAVQTLRTYMNSVVLLNDEFMQFAVTADQRFPLFEGQRRELREAAWLDKIVNTAKAVQGKYQDISYGLLASLTTKTMNALNAAKLAQQIDPQSAGTMTQVLQHITKVGQFAAQNPRLILLCVGMVTSLAGIMHTNPAHAADAATHLDSVLGDNAQLNAALKKLQDATDQTDTAMQKFYQASNSGGQGTGTADLTQHVQPTQAVAQSAQQPAVHRSFQDRMNDVDNEANTKEMTDQADLAKGYTNMGYSPAQAQQKALADFVATHHRQPGQTPK